MFQFAGPAISACDQTCSATPPRSRASRGAPIQPNGSRRIGRTSTRRGVDCRASWARTAPCSSGGRAGTSKCGRTGALSRFRRRAASRPASRDF